MAIDSQQTNLAGSRTEPATLKSKEFRIDSVPAGSSLLVGDVAVFNVAGNLCGTQSRCTHQRGPLSQSKLDGSTVTCPWHGSQFDVCTAAVLRGPAVDPLKTNAVVAEGQVGRVEDRGTL